MHCIGDSDCRFEVVAGPDPWADRQEAINQLVMAAAQSGVYCVRADCSERTRFTFEIQATTPEEACEFVTVRFRSVYGLNWWAEISMKAVAPFEYAQALSWN